MPPQAKPILNLTGPRTGLPSLDDLIKLTKALTGRDPTPEEIEAAKRTIAKHAQ